MFQSFSIINFSMSFNLHFSSVYSLVGIQSLSSTFFWKTPKSNRLSNRFKVGFCLKYSILVLNSARLPNIHFSLSLPCFKALLSNNGSSSSDMTFLRYKSSIWLWYLLRKTPFKTSICLITLRMLVMSKSWLRLVLAFSKSLSFVEFCLWHESFCTIFKIISLKVKLNRIRLVSSWKKS